MRIPAHLLTKFSPMLRDFNFESYSQQGQAICLRSKQFKQLQALKPYLLFLYLNLFEEIKMRLGQLKGKELRRVYYGALFFDIQQLVEYCEKSLAYYYTHPQKIMRFLTRSNFIQRLQEKGINPELGQRIANQIDLRRALVVLAPLRVDRTPESALYEQTEDRTFLIKKKVGNTKILIKKINDSPITNNFGFDLYVKKMLLAYAEESTIRVLDLSLTGIDAYRIKFELHADSNIHQLRFSRKNLLVSVHRDYSVKIWSIDTGDCIASLEHTNKVDIFLFNNTNSHILTKQNDDTQEQVFCWDLEKKERAWVSEPFFSCRI